MLQNDQQGRTDHLESVIQDVIVSQQTGILHVERGKGGVREGGDIVFLQGQVIEATVGKRMGPEAFDWLYTWGNCQYTFHLKQPHELHPGIPIAAIEGPTTSPVTPIPPLLNPPSEQKRAYENVTDELFGPIHTDKYAQLPDSGKLKPVNPGQREASRYAEPRPPRSFRLEGIQNLVPAPTQPSYLPEPTLRAPTRMQKGPEALVLLERFRLSRLHRHVFLLLDGQRTAHDLVRLTGRPLNEIERLLNDLERCGLIWQEKR